MRSSVFPSPPVLLACALWACATTTAADATTTSSSTAALTTTSQASASSTTDAYLSLAMTPNTYYQYYVQLTDEQSSTMGVKIDYLKPDVLFVDARSVMQCDDFLSVVSEYFAASSSEWPEYVTQSSRTYHLSQCYLTGDYIPVAVTTEVSGSVTKVATVTAVSDTSATFEATYADNSTASGYVLQGNLTFGLQNNRSLTLPDFTYLLAEDSNLYGGVFGLLDNGQSTNFLRELQAEAVTPGQGYSAFYYHDANITSSLAGYLLLGSVDSRLYTGDFYSYPRIEYSGTFVAGHHPPIVPLDDVTLVNQENGNSASLNTQGSFPVVFDSSLYFSYLPLDILVNLALQLNAYYSSADGAWIVQCSDLENSNATLNFQFGPLTVNVTLSDLLFESHGSDDETLKFNDGESVCFLNIVSNENVGYSVLGNSFFKNVYMAQDNELGRVGLANANKNLKWASSGADISKTKTHTGGYISAGYIPLATVVNTTQTYTLTFSDYNYSQAASVPAGLANVQIESGYVYVTNSFSSSAQDSATAANAHSSSGANTPCMFVSVDKSVLYVILALGGLMGVLFM